MEPSEKDASQGNGFAAAIIAGAVAIVPVIVIAHLFTVLVLTDTQRASRSSEEQFPISNPVMQDEPPRVVEIDYTYDPDLALVGEDMWFNAGCFECHSDDGNTDEGPTLLNLYGSQVLLADGRTVIADAEYIRRSVMDPYVEARPEYKEDRRMPPPVPGLFTEYDLEGFIEFCKSLSGPNVEQSEPAPETE